MSEGKQNKIKEQESNYVAWSQKDNFSKLKQTLCKKIWVIPLPLRVRASESSDQKICKWAMYHRENARAAEIHKYIQEKMYQARKFLPPTSHSNTSRELTSAKVHLGTDE